MDPENPIVRLCVEGMRMEAEGNSEVARSHYQRAWDTAADDYEACIAAHYLARQQENDHEALHWNQEAIRRAEAADDERMESFYPSLYLNMGKSYEEAGDIDEARRHYELAAERIRDVPAGQYRDVLLGGVENALRRVGQERMTESDFPEGAP